ncbi:hypothetical protein T02_10536 [Trichinella nativa]|uniref:Uncharacterized protein n=1 Tax=Trichinella nativa TaxID=6335 RepID=A0A0V1L2I4_9BILA|nr:hypothetical protein T02_10536 [Trichinella nativa]
MVILRCRELFVALFDSHRNNEMGSSYIPLQELRRSWFEYRIEIKKEPDQHISQEQPGSHRRMAIFDCMPVEITVAIELKSNKKGVTHIMCTLAEEWLCGIGFRSAVMTTRGSHPCRQLSSRASFTILPSPGQLLVMNSRTVVSSGNIRPINNIDTGQGHTVFDDGE